MIKLRKERIDSNESKVHDLIKKITNYKLLYYDTSPIIFNVSKDIKMKFDLISYYSNFELIYNDFIKFIENRYKEFTKKINEYEKNK